MVYGHLRKLFDYKIKIGSEIVKKKIFTSDMILDFNKYLSTLSIELPEKYKIINPFNSEAKNNVEKLTQLFYHKYYDDTKKRRIILGSSPARRGTAVTGVPFEDAIHLQNTTGIYIEDFYVNKSSSNFLYNVMELYGGPEKFYNDFYMNFICPVGIARVNSKGKEVNCNYYENKQLQNRLYDLIVTSLKKQVEFNIDRSICYCIGSGENYKFLKLINEKYKFFDKIIPLEHPRFITQYNSKKKDYYLKKYLTALTKDKKNIIND